MRRGRGVGVLIKQRKKNDLPQLWAVAWGEGRRVGENNTCAAACSATLSSLALGYQGDAPVSTAALQSR